MKKSIFIFLILFGFAKVYSASIEENTKLNINIENVKEIKERLVSLIFLISEKKGRYLNCPYQYSVLFLLHYKIKKIIRFAIGKILQ